MSPPDQLVGVPSSPQLLLLSPADRNCRNHQAPEVPHRGWWGPRLDKRRRALFCPGCRLLGFVDLAESPDNIVEQGGEGMGGDVHVLRETAHVGFQVKAVKWVGIKLVAQGVIDARVVTKDSKDLTEVTVRSDKRKRNSKYYNVPGLLQQILQAPDGDFGGRDLGLASMEGRGTAG